MYKLCMPASRLLPSACKAEHGDKAMVRCVWRSGASAHEPTPSARTHAKPMQTYTTHHTPITRTVYARTCMHADITGTHAQLRTHLLHDHQQQLPAWVVGLHSTCAIDEEKQVGLQPRMQLLSRRGMRSE